MQFSSLFNSSSNVENDVLNIDLFNINQGFINNKKESNEEFYINLDNDKKKDQVKSKIDKVFDDPNLNNNEKEGQDDLLDLMDKI